MARGMGLHSQDPTKGEASDAITRGLALKACSPQDLVWMHSNALETVHALKDEEQLISLVDGLDLQGRMLEQLDLPAIQKFIIQLEDLSEELAVDEPEEKEWRYVN